MASVTARAMRGRTHTATHPSTHPSSCCRRPRRRVSGPPTLLSIVDVVHVAYYDPSRAASRPPGRSPAVSLRDRGYFRVVSRGFVARGASSDRAGVKSGYSILIRYIYVTVCTARRATVRHVYGKAPARAEPQHAPASRARNSNGGADRPARVPPTVTTRRGAYIYDRTAHHTPCDRYRF